MTSELGALMERRPSSTLFRRRSGLPVPAGWVMVRRPWTLSMEIGPLLEMWRPFSVLLERISYNSLLKLQSNLPNCGSGSFAILEKREPALKIDPSAFCSITPESAIPNFLAI